MRLKKEKNESRQGKLAEHRRAQAAQAAARHRVPFGALTLSRERLMQRTPERYLSLHLGAVAVAPGASKFLNPHGPYARAGRSTGIAAYAGGAIINHLPRAKGGRRRWA